MKTFQSKPSFVRAEQWFKEGDVHQAPIVADILQTKKGLISLQPGDWIVYSEYWEKWFVVPDSKFNKKYEEVPV